jgi:diacylglycerol O-acyltransferase
VRTSYDRMSAQDAGYLERETDSQPLHFVLEIDVAGAITVEQVRSHVLSRLGAAPSLLRRLRYPLLAGRPVWVDDPDFDIARQVVPREAPVATDEERTRSLLELTMRRIPRDRPLWKLTVASGTDRTTLWLAVHHALMDGGLLVQVLADLFPADPGPVPAPVARHGPSRLRLLLLVLLRRVRRSAGAPASAPSGRAVPVPSVLAGPVSASRSLGVTRVPLSHLAAERARTAATVNDLFLDAATTALRSYLPDPPQEVLALVPRDVRSDEQASRAGNRSWSMHVVLPLGTADRDARLAQIRAATHAGKRLQTTAGSLGWGFDVALTNVRLRGPHAVAGVPVSGYRVAVPLQGQNRLVGTATSYGGDLTVTWTADGERFPDVDRLAALTADAFMAMG